MRFQVRDVLGEAIELGFRALWRAPHRRRYRRDLKASELARDALLPSMITSL
ncbi:hypothetical protein [Bradyrhizobium sp. UFLA05-153]